MMLEYMCVHTFIPSCVFPCVENANTSKNTVYLFFRSPELGYLYTDYNYKCIADELCIVLHLVVVLQREREEDTNDIRPMCSLNRKIHVPPK